MNDLRIVERKGVTILNPLPDNQILAMSKFKALADDIVDGYALF